MDGDAAVRAPPWEERNPDIKADTKEIIATEERGELKLEGVCQWEGMMRRRCAPSMRDFASALPRPRHALGRYAAWPPLSPTLIGTLARYTMATTRCSPWPPRSTKSKTPLTDFGRRLGASRGLISLKGGSLWRKLARSLLQSRRSMRTH